MGQYSRKETVSGYLIPDKGLIKVFSQKQGYMAELAVKHGDFIEKGDVLFSVNTQSNNELGEVTEVKLTKELANQYKYMKSELTYEEKTLLLDKKILQQNINDSEIELIILKDQLMNEDEQISIISRSHEKLLNIFRNSHISKTDLDLSKSQLLIEQQNKNNINLEIIRLQKSINQEQLAYDGLDNKYQKVILSKKGELSKLKHQLIQATSKGSYTVVAPVSGRIVALTTALGENVSSKKSILSILPKDAKLEARLYVPSTAIGFINDEQLIKLRYKSFPYQKFGVHKGIIKRVGKTILSNTEFDFKIKNDLSVYRVDADLDKQYILAYGKKIVLQSGMEFDADIIIEERSLIMWLFDPLLSIKGKT